MNTKEFVKVLRAVIREEVRAAVKQELAVVLLESKKQTRPITQTRPAPKNTNNKSITGNPVLDQVLNETKLTSDFRQSADVGYDDFGSFTTNNIQQPTSMMEMDVVDDYESPLPDMGSSMPFMRDYSQLLKKADQIAQQKQF